MTNAELIKALRNCSSAEGTCAECSYKSRVFPGTCNGCKWNLMHDAADALEAAEQRIKEFEARLPKEGEWIYEDLDNFRKYKVTCPHCGELYIGNYDAYDEPSDFNYCPHCGNICNPANLAWEKELSERERKEQNDGES